MHAMGSETLFNQYTRRKNRVRRKKTRTPKRLATLLHKQSQQDEMPQVAELLQITSPATEKVKKTSFKEEDIEIEIPRGEDYESAKESDAEFKDPRTPLNQFLRKRHFDSCDKENFVLSARKIKSMLMDEEQLNFLLYAYDKEIDIKVNTVKSYTEINCKMFEMRLNMILARLPDSVKNMTVGEFQEKYNEDVNTLLKTRAEENIQQLEKKFAELKSSSSSYKTPSVNRFRAPMYPPTTLQTPQQLQKKKKTTNPLNTPLNHSRLQANKL